MMNGVLPKEGTVYRILLKGSEAASVLTEWWEASACADLRVRKAKTPKHVVVETTDTVFAAHVLRMWPGSPVNVKEPKP